MLELISRLSVLISYSFLLILAAGVGSFAGYSANSTRKDLELVGVQTVSNTSLSPVALSGKIAVVELCPKEEMFLGGGVFRKLLSSQNNFFTYMPKALSTGKKKEFVSTWNPFVGFLQGHSSRDYFGENKHQLNVEGRSFSCVLDRTSHSHSFPCFRFSVLPRSSRILSGLNSIAVVTKPRSLLQVRSVRVKDEVFSNQLRLVTSGVGVDGRYNYQQESRDSSNPVWSWPWPSFFFALGCLAGFLGVYLLYIRACSGPGSFVRWRALVLGFCLVGATFLLIHLEMEGITRWQWNIDNPSAPYDKYF